ncbi:hypothetical protein GCM10009675_01390 [Prauserella alba]|uniref:Uncharacterized protein n=1 Tax=Prauserella alba TaxID=176898 RepID=A0ABP4FNJ5_9PSEU
MSAVRFTVYEWPMHGFPHYGVNAGGRRTRRRTHRRATPSRKADNPDVTDEKTERVCSRADTKRVRTTSVVRTGSPVGAVRAASAVGAGDVTRTIRTAGRR